MDVNYKNPKKYNTAKFPIRQPIYLTWLIWILSKIILFGKPYRINRAPLQINSLHVEYDFPHIKPFDCVDISTEDDSFYCFPTKQNVITKMAFATEVLYQKKLAAVRRGQSAAKEIRQ